MKRNIEEIFEKNIRIMDGIGKAIIYSREGRYENMLLEIGEISEDITYIADTIMKEREYFDLVSVDSVAEMLQGILEAKYNEDFVLLADLLELQMESFIYNVQNYIMNKEDLFMFQEEDYDRRLSLLKQRLKDSVQWEEELKEELNPSRLLKDGYRVEFTSCGLMTLAAKDGKGVAHYLHTNHKISQEAFLLARSWVQGDAKVYILYGLGLGYHVRELLKLKPNAVIEIFESDMNILKLCCAFSHIEDVLLNHNVSVVYDPDGQQYEQRKQHSNGSEKICIHYPSYCRSN